MKAAVSSACIPTPMLPPPTPRGESLCASCAGMDEVSSVPSMHMPADGLKATHPRSRASSKRPLPRERAALVQHLDEHRAVLSCGARRGAAVAACSREARIATSDAGCTGGAVLRQNPGRVRSVHASEAG